jgi:hypothetical protein
VFNCLLNQYYYGCCVRHKEDKIVTFLYSKELFSCSYNRNDGLFFDQFSMNLDTNRFGIFKLNIIPNIQVLCSTVSIVQCSTVSCSEGECSIVYCSAVQYSAFYSSAVQHSTAQNSSIPHRI